MPLNKETKLFFLYILFLLGAWRFISFLRIQITYDQLYEISLLCLILLNKIKFINMFTATLEILTFI